MPYSSDSGKAFIDKSIAKLKRFNPFLFNNEKFPGQAMSVLDIGAGSGTYFNRYKNVLKNWHWTGVEIWNPYIEQFKLQDKYGVIYAGDAEEYFESQPPVKTSITFLGDIVEHMTKEKAARVIDHALKNTDVLFVSIPIGYYPQGEFEGNPYEVHVTDNWTLQEALDFLGPNVVSYKLDNEIGVFALTLNVFVKSALETKVAVYGICKNEEAFIERFLTNVGFASPDQLVLCDTGSTDKTIDKIKAYIKDYDLHTTITFKQIHVNPWRFDDARNTAMALVWPEIDVCISLDIDEYLSANFIDEVRKLLKAQPSTTRINHRFSTFWSEDEKSFSDHWHERIHARTGYRWVLPVHEKLETHGDEVLGWLDNIRMYQKPDLTKNTRSSYKTLLEQSVRERPDIWKSWSFLAAEYAQIAEYDKAIEAVKSAMKVADSDKAYLNLQLGYFNEHAGNFSAAEEHFATASFYAPHVREYKVRIAEYLERRGEIDKSNFYLMQARNIKDRTFGYEYDPTCWTAEFEQRLALAK